MSYPLALRPIPALVQIAPGRWIRADVHCLKDGRAYAVGMRPRRYFRAGQWRRVDGPQWEPMD